MNGVVYVTDHDWFRFLASRPDLDEVNFWRPRDLSTPRQLAPGMPVLFKLRKQHGGAIVGYGVFAKHRVMPAWLAWDLFGPSNGASTFAQMLARIVRLRGGEVRPAGGAGDFDIGCVMLSQPVFLPAELDPDVAKVFRNAEQVNSALRALAELIRRHRGKTRTRRRA